MEDPTARELISQAFSGVGIPPVDQIVLYSPEISPEGGEILTAFRGKGWRQLDRDLVLEHYGALTFLAPAGFHSLIPAYMIHGLDSYYDLQDVVAATVWNLTPPVGLGEESEAKFLSRAAQFSRPQRSAIMRYLACIAEADARDWGPDPEGVFVTRTAAAMEFWSKPPDDCPA